MITLNVNDIFVVSTDLNKRKTLHIPLEVGNEVFFIGEEKIMLQKVMKYIWILTVCLIILTGCAKNKDQEDTPISGTEEQIQVDMDLES